MGHLITVATCSLNQWALDFEGNTERIIKSIHLAKEAGARLRVGPELEICGYGCLDHLLEQDLYLHCWEMLQRILLDKSCYDCVLDIGMPVQHRNQRFNCRVLCLDGKILMIRPKMWLANDGNYREMRHFIPWLRPQETEEYHLPRMIQELQGATHVTFGDAVVSTPDTCFGAETCEELFTPRSPHITLQKLDVRLKLITEATRKCGGVYLYSNQKGCDGDRLFYDGSCMILVNGDVVAQGSQFSLLDVEVVTATVDLEEIRAYRSSISRGLQAATSKAKYQRVQVPFELGSGDEDLDISLQPSRPITPKFHSVEEEIALCAGAYLWDYLRRSGTAGYLVPLSGGIDSCATATIVFSMCRMAIEAIEQGNAQVIEDVKRLAKYKGDGVLPKTPQALCNQIFHTIYMGMKKQSSRETRQRAKDLSEAIGSYHINLDIDDVYEAQKNLLVSTMQFEPKFKVEGGTQQENLTLQCLQARIRMVTAYDCSSADINPIGSIDKTDLKRFIHWAEKEFEIPCLHEFLTAVPTAELEPITDTYVQSDEVDMGMTYPMLSIMGRHRRVNRLGPFGMFQRLVHDWSADREAVPGDEAPFLTPAETAQKVKHLLCMLCNDYSPDDNRFDLRPFLYPPFWKSWSFKKIDRELAKIEKRKEKQSA
ncbi:hypothetical protein G7Z17_g3816 [Cylindrodendrum hubeiense]|uniref:Glutamine-dependent NAD(+) synthetase n=1 Tax=Cylindrodendrum hubeiense TaxID=595255 RepID=A0A9P5LD71_9HYPO|nr:hypothetical protein G7Z17_g3816 [Cylindrodendrum hubeiense]